MTKLEFIEAVRKLNIALSNKQIEQFDLYAKLLAEWNEKMNLTSITEIEQVYEKHFYDSLLPFKDLSFHTMCDVGSGAGFPGLPVKIAYPEIELTIVEPLQKRCRFLEEVCAQLGLSGVHIVCARAEDHVKVAREFFDLVSARAVARLPILLELCVPLVKKEGYMVALKGRQGHEELIEAKPALDCLKVELIKEDALDLNEGMRINLYFKKVDVTPKKYPRAYGQIKKKPLGGLSWEK